MNTEQIIEYLPFLIPLVIVEMALALIALVHVIRHPNYKFGNKVMWIVIVLVLQYLGPVIYFLIGRGDE